MVGAVGRISKVVAALEFFFTGRVGKAWREGGGASTFFPLRFHRGNPKSCWHTSEIRSASTTSTKLNPPSRHKVFAVREGGVAPVSADSLSLG